MVCRYIMDKKESRAIIESDILKCSRCKKELEEDTYVRFATGEKKLVCEHCCIKGSDVDWKFNPLGFYPGLLRGVKK